MLFVPNRGKVLNTSIQRTASGQSVRPTTQKTRGPGWGGGIGEKKYRAMTMAPFAPGKKGADKSVPLAIKLKRWPMSHQQASRQLNISLSTCSTEGEQEEECTSPSACPLSRPNFNVYRAAEAGDMGVMVRYLNSGGDANKAGKVCVCVRMEIECHRNLC